MAKLLVQVRASKNDPEYHDRIIMNHQTGDGLAFRNFFNSAGVGVLEEDLVISCHGCPDLTDKATRQINSLAKNHRVGVIAAGGLFFGLPSIMAARMPTVPVISVPLDGGWYGGVDALLAPNVPSGTAAIGGVAINGYSYAANAMRNILSNDFQGVHLYNPNDKLVEALDKFGVPVLGTARDGLPDGPCLIAGLIDERGTPVGDLDYFTRSSAAIFTTLRHDNMKELEVVFSRIDGVYARGEENVAILAAKAMAAYHPGIAERLGEASVLKARGYRQRDITLNSFVGVGE